jgi:serine/threonine protein phosphatase PrpC
MAHGVPREVAETGPRAHAITRWMGAGAPDPVPRLSTVTLAAPGWLLVCSDGLWNYCSEAADLATLVAQGVAAAGPEPAALAVWLIGWANEQGGRDNITAAVIRIPG